MWPKKRNPVGDFSKTSEESRWQAMALAWHSASTAWLASGPGIKQLLGRRNCRNCLHNRLKPVKYQTVPGTEQAPSEDGFFSLCFLSCYSMGWHCLQPIQIHRCSPVLITGLLFLFEPLVYVCMCVWRGVCVCVHSVASCCGHMDCCPPGSSVHGILLARILEWVAISYPRGSSQPRDRTCVSCISSNPWPHLIVQFENVVLFPNLIICPCPRLFIAKGSMPVPDTACSMGSYAPHGSPN